MILYLQSLYRQEIYEYLLGYPKSTINEINNTYTAKSKKEDLRTVEVQGFKPLGCLSLLPQAGVSLYDWIAPAIVYIV